MERLVKDLEKVTFQENFQNKFTENCSYNRLPVDSPQLLKITITNCLPNMSIRSDDQMPEKRQVSSFSYGEALDGVEDTDSNCTDGNTFDDSFDGKNELDGESGTDEVHNQTSSGSNRRLRKLPQRSSKSRLEGKRDLRISMKPAKVSVKSTAKLRPSDINKLYTTQKLTSFRPTKLETIFEEPKPIRSRATDLSSDGNLQFHLIGSTKLKRSLTCSDGFNINKTLIKQRRAKIKKNFGHRHTWKKMPLESFMEHMQKSLTTESENVGDAQCTMKQSLVPNGTPPKIVITKIDEEDIMGD